MSGFDVVRAVKHVRDHQGSAPPPPKKPPAPPSATPDQPEDRKPSPAVKIGKTAIPTKHEYVCYECGYRFTVAGKVRTLYCAKCRTILNQADYTIDKPHDVSIVTAGTVTITPEGSWTGGSLSARDVILQGRHEGGAIKASRRMEIHPGATFKLENMETESLVIKGGAHVKAESPMKFRDVDIHGLLEGELAADGLVTIFSGGHFRGSLKTGHIRIDEGGGLTADVEITPS